MTAPTTPLFSIITVTFNAELTIERTLLSVINQSCKDFEYIIIDGASKDNTLVLVQKYLKNIDQLISEPDKGLYDAMNKGIDCAKGKYLCFLNAGDKFHSTKTLESIKKQLSITLTSPDVIYGETAIVNNDGQFLRMRRLATPKNLNWTSFKKGMLVCHQAFMPKRSLTPHYDMSYRYSSDFDWCINILKQAESTHNTNLTQIDYLSEGLTTQNHKASLKERFIIMCKHYGVITTLIQHLFILLRHFTLK